MNKLRNRGSQNKSVNWQLAMNKNTHEIVEFRNGDNLETFKGYGPAGKFTTFLLAYPEIYYAIKDSDLFKDCSSVKNAELSMIDISPDVIITSNKDLVYYMQPQLKNQIKTLTINVKRIPCTIFSGAPLLQSIIIGDDVEVIESQAFKTCPNLTQLTLGKSLRVIESEAFAYCSKLKCSIKVPNSLEEVHQ